MSDNLVVGSSDSSSDDDDGDDDIMNLLRAGISEMESQKIEEEEEQKQQQTDNSVVTKQTQGSTPGGMNIDGDMTTMSHHPLGNRVKQKTTRSSPRAPKQQQQQGEANPELWLGKEEEEVSQSWKSATGMDTQKKQQLKRKKKVLTPAERRERMQRMSKAFVTTSDDTWNKVKMVTIEDADVTDDEVDEKNNIKDRLPPTTTTTTTSGGKKKNVVNSHNTTHSPTTKIQQSREPVLNRKITQKNRQEATKFSNNNENEDFPTPKHSSLSATDAENLLLADLRYTSNPDQLQVLQRLFQVGEKHGSETIMKWIQHQVQLASIPSEASAIITTNNDNNNGRIGSAKPSSPPSIDTNRNSSRNRFTNHPKPSIQQFGGTQNIPNNPVLAERQLIKYFRQAVDSVSVQYNYHDENNNIFSFFVRRPYGMETNHHLWQDRNKNNASQQNNNNNNNQLPSIITPTDVYSRRAHISTLSTMEVMVLLLLSSSSSNNNNNIKNQSTNNRSFPILVMYGTTGVRYRSNLNGPWITVVDSNSKNKNNDRRPSLGRINLFPSSPFSAYNNPGSITNSTSSGAIDLEEIFQQALWVREHYGSTVTNTAMALSKNPNPVLPSTSDQSSANPTTTTTTAAAATTTTRDCGVNTTVTSDQMTMLEQNGMRRRGRSIFDNETTNDVGTSRSPLNTNKHETKKVKKNNIKVSKVMLFIRSNSSILLLLVSFGILLGVWLIRPSAFSRYNI